MNDEVETLRAEIDDLKRRLGEHESLRGTAINALGSVTQTMGRLRNRLAVIDHPVIAAAREEGLLPKMAILMTRQTATEERLDETIALAINQYDLLTELLDFLRLKPGQQAE